MGRQVLGATLALVLCVGCGTAPTAPACRGSGQACATTTDCCSQFVCTSGSCAPPSTCGMAGDLCASASDCCSGLTCVTSKAACAMVVCGTSKPCSGGRSYKACATSSYSYYQTSDGTIFDGPTGATDVVAWCNATTMCRSAGQSCGGTSTCCSGLTCSAGTCTMPMTCKSAGQSCSKMSDCCAGLTCPRYGTTCAKGDIGDPCTSSTQCAVGYCDGWCTQACSSDAACGSTNYCIQATTGFICFPYCSTGADCSIYSGTICTTGTDPDGLTLKICSS